VRVRAQDTYEHVTEFASAADHTQTREKWLEMGVPIVKERQNPREFYKTGERKVSESVFEEYLDNTDPEALVRVQTQPQERSFRGANAHTMVPKQRWKYTSPHIGGMQEGEFQAWLEKKVTPEMRLEWREFLRQQEMKVRVARERRRARDEGRPLSVERIKQLEVELLPTDEALEQIEKKLRDRHIEDSLSSTLSQLLTEFLDLPPLPGLERTPARTSGLQAQVNNIVADKAPPSTHPSAGLSHLRTNAIMDNHPLYGPQKHRTPVEARVVRPRFTGTNLNEHSARLGVGGFVAADPVTATYNPRDDPNKIKTMSIPDRMATHLEPDIIGGNKLWVHPENAQIDDKGRVSMTVSRADNEALAVKKGDVQSIFERKRAGLARPAVGSWSSASVARTAPASPYTAPRPQVLPFDLTGAGAGAGAEGQMGEGDAADVVQRAWEQENGIRR
jgi:hypothetical protein